MEHELSALYDVAHGAGLAVMVPAWMKYVMKHDVNRFAQIAVGFGDAIWTMPIPKTQLLKELRGWKSSGDPSVCLSTLEVRCQGRGHSLYGQEYWIEGRASG